MHREGAMNCLASKQIRILRTITTDSVFKLCIDYLNNRKASYNIHFGKENEAIWKAALLDKIEQTESLDKWLKMVSTVSIEQGYSNVFVDDKFTMMHK